VPQTSGSKKMGVDYYNCDECGEIFPDCDHYGYCCICDKRLCGSCFDQTTSIRVTCTCPEDEKGDDLGCICYDHHPNMEKLRGFTCCKDNHNVCDECLEDKDPYEVKDDELLQYLTDLAKFKSVEEARTACREVKRHKLETKNGSD
jgi:hypothetical protein